MATPAMVPSPGKTDPDLIAELQRLMSDYHAKWTSALAEHTAKGEVSGDTAAYLKRLDDAVKEVVDKQTAITTEMRSIATRTSRPPVPLGAAGEGLDLRSLGAQFTDTDQFKAFVKEPGARPRVQATVKTRVIAPFEQRAINPFVGSATSGLVQYPKRVGVFTQPTIPLVMRDLLDVIPLDTGNAVEYVTETWTLAADYQVNEGDRKAQSDVTYTDKTAVVRTIAHFVKVSRQMLADVPFIRASIDNRLAYGIALKEDKEILYGSGAAGHLLGIMPQATAYAAPFTVTGSIDQMYAAIVQVMQAGYAPTAIVMNPVNFASMQIAKNTMGAYLLGGPPQSDATPRLWGLPVAQTMNMTPGDFLVGAFPGNAALFDREATVVEISFENEDDFVRNLATIRAEERITLAVFVPAAFVKGTLAATPVIAGTGAEHNKSEKK